MRNLDRILLLCVIAFAFAVGATSDLSSLVQPVVGIKGDNETMRHENSIYYTGFINSDSQNTVRADSFFYYKTSDFYVGASLNMLGSVQATAKVTSDSGDTISGFAFIEYGLKASGSPGTQIRWYATYDTLLDTTGIAAGTKWPIQDAWGDWPVNLPTDTTKDGTCVIANVARLILQIPDSSLMARYGAKAINGPRGLSSETMFAKQDSTN